MSLNVLREEPDHFVLKGDAGSEFKVKKAALSKTAHAKMRHLANGGEVRKYADGDVVAPEGGGERVSVTPESEKVDLLSALKRGAEQARGEPSGGSTWANSDGIPSPVDLPSDAVYRGPPDDASGSETTGGAATTQAKEADKPIPELLRRPDEPPDPSAGQPGQTGQAPSPAFPAMPPPAAGILGGRDVMGAAGEVGKALDERAIAEKTASESLAKAEEGRAQAERVFAAKQEAEYGANRARMEKMFNDLQDPKNDIKPDHFWADKTTGDRVRMGIGMLLSGIGSGLTGQPNLAAQMIGRAIDRDMEAQKANLGRKQNALSFYSQQMQNDQAARLMTHASAMNAVAAEIAAAAHRAGGALAAPNAVLAAKQLHMGAIQAANQATALKYQMDFQRYSMEVQRSIMQQAFSGANGSGGDYLPSRAPPPMLSEFTPEGIFKMKKDAAERTLIGPGGKPYLAYDKTVAEKIRPQLAAANQFETALGELDGLRKGSTGLPGTVAANKFQKVRASMPELWAMANGMVQPSEQTIEQLDKILPTKWDAFARGKFTFDPAREMLHSRRSALHEEAGLHPSAMPIFQRPRDSGGK